MWGKNVRAVVAAETWNSLRWRYDATDHVRRINLDFPDEVWTARADYKETRECQICGTSRRTLELHEEWSFDDANRVQRLDAFMAICPKCHLAKHLGHANATGHGEEALEHLASVNGWARKEAEAYADAAFEIWADRSASEYQLDLTALEREVPLKKIHLDWLGGYRSWFGSRLDAVVWAREVIASNAVIIDTETTGLPSLMDEVEVIELAGLNTRGEVLFESLFRPRGKIPNSAMHGITDRMVRKSPTFVEKWPEIAELFRDREVISYNARFDRQVMQMTCDIYNFAQGPIRWSCVMQAWWTFNRLPYTKLPDGEHRAAGDARAALKLIHQMAEATELHVEDDFY
jgi:hypothetical protein